MATGEEKSSNRLDRVSACARLSDLSAQLEAAGLELWQAPEGFWAVRVKPAAPAAAATTGRPRRRAVRGGR